MERINKAAWLLSCTFSTYLRLTLCHIIRWAFMASELFGALRLSTWRFYLHFGADPLNDYSRINIVFGAASLGIKYGQLLCFHPQEIIKISLPFFWNQKSLPEKPEKKNGVSFKVPICSKIKHSKFSFIFPRCEMLLENHMCLALRETY